MTRDGVARIPTQHVHKLLGETTKYVDTASHWTEGVDKLFLLKRAVEQRQGKFAIDIDEYRKMRWAMQEYIGSWKDYPHLWDGSYRYPTTRAPNVPDQDEEAQQAEGAEQPEGQWDEEAEAEQYEGAAQSEFDFTEGFQYPSDPVAGDSSREAEESDVPVASSSRIFLAKRVRVDDYEDSDSDSEEGRRTRARK